MCALHARGLKKRTLENNFLTFKILSGIYLKRDFKWIDFSGLMKCSQLLIEDFGSKYKLSTLKGFLINFNGMIKMIYGYKHVRATI